MLLDMDIPAGWAECKGNEYVEGVFAQGKVYGKDCWSMTNRAGVLHVDVRAGFDNWVSINRSDMEFHGWKFVKKAPFDPKTESFIIENMAPAWGMALRHIFTQKFTSCRNVRLTMDYVDEDTSDVVE